jgi:hypothetical protein
MNMTHFLLAAPIALITLYSYSVSNLNSTNSLASPKTEIAPTQTIVNDMKNPTCNPYRSCPQKD